jgi:hypothetical protein
VANRLLAGVLQMESSQGLRSRMDQPCTSNAALAEVLSRRQSDAPPRTPYLSAATSPRSAIHGQVCRMNPHCQPRTTHTLMPAYQNCALSFIRPSRLSAHSAQRSSQPIGLSGSRSRHRTLRTSESSRNECRSHRNLPRSPSRPAFLQAASRAIAFGRRSTSTDRAFSWRNLPTSPSTSRIKSPKTWAT